MAIQILNNCSFDLSKIAILYVGSSTTGNTTIQYPIQYTTVSGSTDSKIAITDWDTINDVVTIGGQAIVVNKIVNTGDNLVFSEDLIIDSNGKTYKKNLTFVIPQLNTFLINQLLAFTLSADGKRQLAPTIAFLVDDNQQTLVLGHDKPLYLQTTDFQIGESNQVSLSYTSSSYSRARAYEII